MNPYEDNDESSGWGTAAKLAGLAALATPIVHRPIMKQLRRANNYFDNPFAPVMDPITKVAQKLKAGGMKAANEFGASGDVAQRVYRAGSVEGRPIEEGFKQNAYDTWAGMKNIGRVAAALGQMTPAAVRELRGTNKAPRIGFTKEEQEAFRKSKLGQTLPDDVHEGIAQMQGYASLPDAAIAYLRYLNSIHQ